MGGLHVWGVHVWQVIVVLVHLLGLGLGLGLRRTCPQGLGLGPDDKVGAEEGEIVHDPPLAVGHLLVIHATSLLIQLPIYGALRSEPHLDGLA